MRRAAGSGRVRVSASGHSFTDIALTDATMVRLDRLTRRLGFDAATGRFQVEAGVGPARAQPDARRARGRLREPRRHRPADRSRGRSPPGPTAPASASATSRLRSPRSSWSRPTARSCASTAPTPTCCGPRASASGALGVIYSVTLSTVPAFTLDRVDSAEPAGRDARPPRRAQRRQRPLRVLRLPAHQHRAVPREPPDRRAARAQAPGARLRAGGDARELGRPGLRAGGAHLPSQAPRLARIASRGVGRSTKVDRSYKVFASQRHIQFTEMEYGAPARARQGDAIERVLARGRPPRARRRLPDRGALRRRRRLDAEPVARARHLLHRRPPGPQARLGALLPRGRGDRAPTYGGRPHWGKRHFHDGRDLAPLYPGWDDFAAVRARLDPDGVFANDYTDRVLGPGRRGA